MEESPIKKLLLQHLYRNRVKDQLVAIDKEIALHERQLIELRKELKTGGRKVNKLDRLKKLSLFQSKTQEDLERAQQVESNAYDSYEGKLNHIKELKEEKESLIKEFQSLEKVEEKLDLLVEEKAILFQEDPRFKRQLNILELKRKRLYSFEEEYDRIKEQLLEVQSVFKKINRDIRMMTNPERTALEFYGKGRLSSYKKKKLIATNKERVVEASKLFKELITDLNQVKIEFETAVSFDLIDRLLDQMLEMNLVSDPSIYGFNSRLLILRKTGIDLRNIQKVVEKNTAIISVGNRQIDRERMFFIVDY